MDTAEIAILISACSVVATAIGAVAALWARVDSSKSASAAEKSANAAEESNHIAAENLKTYRDEIAYAKRIMLDIDTTYGLLFREGQKRPPLSQARMDLSSIGICAIVTIHNTGKDVVINRAYLKPVTDAEDTAIGPNIEKIGQGSILIPRNKSDTLSFLLSHELVNKIARNEDVDILLHLELSEDSAPTLPIKQKDYLTLRNCILTLNTNGKAEERALYFPPPDRFEVEVEPDLHG